MKCPVRHPSNVNAKGEARPCRRDVGHMGVHRDWYGNEWRADLGVVDGDPSEISTRREWFEAFCRERDKVLKLEAEIAALGRRGAHEPLAEALRLIMGKACQRRTTGLGSCLKEPSWTKDAEYTSDRWCDSCIAFDALNHPPALRGVGTPLERYDAAHERFQWSEIRALKQTVVALVRQLTAAHLVARVTPLDVAVDPVEVSRRYDPATGDDLLWVPLGTLHQEEKADQ